MKVAFKWKIVVIGDPSVGKTSLMLKYTEKKFTELYIPTVGVQVSIKQVPVRIDKEKALIDLNIWDIAGHDKFLHIRRIFYEGTNAFLLLYDITNEATFEGTTYWYKDISKTIGNKYGILIGNKKDLVKNRFISEKKGKKRAAEFGLDFEETSAKTGENVENVFEMLSQKLLTLHAE